MRIPIKHMWLVVCGVCSPLSLSLSLALSLALAPSPTYSCVHTRECSSRYAAYVASVYVCVA